MIKEVTPEEEKTYKVAVYGSLRKGLHNYDNLGLKNAKLLGAFETEPKYTMYDINGAFPGLKENGTTSITMEVYEVDQLLMDNIDALEGYSEEESSYNYYNKVVMDTPYGEAYGYIFNAGVSKCEVVETGDWVTFKVYSNLING